MITQLTQKQIDAMPRYVEEWTGYGLSTEPADRPRAEAAIRQVYEQAGLKQPAIVWCQSPLSMVLTKEVRASVRASVWDSVRDSVWASVGDSVWDSVWDSVRDSVWASVGDSVWDSVWASVRDSVWDSVRDSVWASVGDSVGDSVWDSVWDSVRDSVGASVRDSVRDSVGASVRDSVGASVRDSVGASVRASVWDSVYGQHEAPWLAFYRFFHVECDLVGQTGKLSGLWELCQSAGWALPCENICFVSERHSVCTVDRNGLIHNETGPAILYPDGFQIHAWHGQRVPAEWIENTETIDPVDVLKTQNVEQRAAGVAILGMERVLDELQHEIVDSDPDPERGDLIRVHLPDLPDPGFYLRALCPRNGRIMEAVNPKEMDELTVRGAQAWRLGIPASDFTYPEKRT